VPLREEEMSSYEIMLSESQERMLMVIKKEHEESVKKIFEKWDLHAVTIGEVTEGNLVEIYYEGELKATVPAGSLVLGEGAPVYKRETKEPQYLKRVHSFDPNSVPLPQNYNDILLKLLESPNIASKRWVYHQYDSMVRTNTVEFAGDAAVVRIKGTNKALAMKTDCNGRYVYLNPRRGGQIAVTESARNVVCAGATPLAITNCLNFGNPYDPEVYWQFKEAVAGVGEACRALDTPVTGGNVSFYNESPEAAVYPTPVIGMLGLIEDTKYITPSFFQSAGDDIILLGETLGEIGGSEYLSLVVGNGLGDAPALDLANEKQLQGLCLELIKRGLVQSAHDCSEGGLAVALAECCFGEEQILGAVVANAIPAGIRPDFWLYGEDQSRIIISASRENYGEIMTIAAGYKIAANRIGKVQTKARLEIESFITIDLQMAKNAYENAIPKAMGE
jgi:phosphoribosylformylglycinamidine synthase